MASRSRFVVGARSLIANPRLHFSIGVGVVLLVTFLHTMALPLIVSYDGMEYAHLANVLSGPSIISHWNFYRTPLFPLALNRAFWLGGEQPKSALLVTTLFGTAGILLVGLIVRKIAGGTSAAIALVVMVFYPVLVGYEHMLLSETGIVFWIALLLWSLVCLTPASKPGAIWVPCCIALVIALGYYWRPTILFLAPAAALAFLCIVLLSSAGARPYSELLRKMRTERRVIAGTLIIAFTPFLLAYPWMHLTAEHRRGAYDDFVAQGMFRQVVVPLDDPLLARVRAEYRDAIEHDVVNGRLPLDGVTIGGHTELLNKIRPLFARAGVWRLIRRHPFRYVEGVAKSMIFFLGVPDHRVDDENWNFSHAVFTVWPATDTLDRSVGWDPKFVQFAPKAYVGGAFVGKAFDALMPVYTWLVLASTIVSFIWMVVSLKQGETIGLALTAIPFALLLVHALTLQAADRYALPVYPLMLANFVVLIRLIWLGFVRKRSLFGAHETDVRSKVLARST
jgi:4-amino-4-deoxy-L-arabinose transferase-like glycosyltransferase